MTGSWANRKITSANQLTQHPSRPTLALLTVLMPPYLVVSLAVHQKCGRTHFRVAKSSMHTACCVCSDVIAVTEPGRSALSSSNAIESSEEDNRGSGNREVPTNRCGLKLFSRAHGVREEGGHHARSQHHSYHWSHGLYGPLRCVPTKGNPTCPGQSDFARFRPGKVHLVLCRLSRPRWKGQRAGCRGAVGAPARIICACEEEWRQISVRPRYNRYPG